MKLFLLFITIFFSYASASSVVATVVKVDGYVKYKEANSFKKYKVKVGTKLKQGALLSTSSGSNAVVKLVDDSTLVIDESSTLRFIDNKNIEQNDGKVFYKITSRDASNALNIKTPFAIIGIKGTTFIADATKNASISLKEGLIGVKSLKEEFELYAKETQKKYDTFLEQQQAEFQRFQNNQAPIKPIITKEFDLNAGKSISFNKNKVKEDDFDKYTKSEFKRFESMLDF